MNPEKFERIVHERNPMTRPGPGIYNGPKVDLSAKVPERPCIELACSNLHAKLDRLNTLVQDLTARLSPILLLPTEPAEDAKCVAADRSDMHNSITSASDKISTIHTSINALMERIDL